MQLFALIHSEDTDTDRQRCEHTQTWLNWDIVLKR